MGGRSALMGGTGVALGADGAAPFTNPATIVHIHDNSIAFSVNFYNFAATSLGGWHQPGMVDQARFGNLSLPGTGVSASGFNALPSTLCLFFTTAGATSPGEAVGVARAGRQKLAACLGTLESQSSSLTALGFVGQTPAGTTSQAQSVSLSWSRVHFGPTYSVAFTDNFGAGLSFHGVYTNDTFSFSGSSITSLMGGGAAASTLTSGGSGHSFDLTAILGATYRFGKVTVGLAGQIYPLHVFGSYDGVLSNSFTAGTTNDATVVSANGSFSAPPPVRLSAGVGGTLNKLTAEIDASFDFPRDTAISTTLTGTTTALGGAGAAMNPLSATYSVATQPTWNVTAGGEYFLASDFSLLGGIGTNFSGLRGLSPTMTVGNLAPDRTNWVNASFGIGSYGPAGHILLGAVLGFGWGQAAAINPYVLPNSWAVVDTQSYSALLVIAGAVNFRSVETAVREVESVVRTGNPDAKPKTPAPASPAETPAKPDKSRGEEPEKGREKEPGPAGRSRSSPD